MAVNETKNTITRIDLSSKGYFSLGKRGFATEESDSSRGEINKFTLSETIQELNISKNKLSELPFEISQLVHLTEVNLSENCLRTIPQALQNSTTLKTLNCSHNMISISDIKSLNLEENFDFLKPKLENKLELSNPDDSIYSEEDMNDSSTSSSSKIPTFSDKSNSVDSGILLVDNSFDFTNLVNLSYLDLSHNELQFFPESLSQLPNLQFLNVSHNYLTCLPPSLKSATSLRHLDLSWNRLVEVPMWVGQLGRCLKLSLSGNPIGDAMEFPKNVGKTCRRIQYLDMENTFIRDFPSALTTLLDLRHLKLSNKKTSLVESNKSIGGGYFERESSWDLFGNKKNNSYNQNTLQNEKDRFLHRNSLWTLPPKISNFVGLVKLEAVDVGLADLPEALGQLRSLKILDVSKNNLSWIPKSFIDLSALEFCNFSKNSILMLPLDIETMPNLTHLLAAFNMVAELPDNIHLLKTLQTLDVYENQIFNVPNHLMEMNLTRFDLAQNDFTKQAFKDHTNQDVFENYWVLQENLRSWDGVLLENQRQNYEMDTSLFLDRKEFRTVVVVETSSHSNRSIHKTNLDLTYSDIDSEEGADFHGNTDSDHMENEATEDEVPPEPEPVSDTEMDDWTNHLDPYGSPPKLSYRHNLLRMDQESWWGSEQFCPADLHATPRNEQILKNWERERQRSTRHVGRGRRIERQTVTLPLLRDSQFDDAI
eukprot:GFUD01027881.1.p1 GENE.GFUD01027881.1~~GFUD01027881.1.p1  ORF type:complete len:709 (+),score=176.51 GFUD01027881.1:57-2183(+)